MPTDTQLADHIRCAVNTERLLETAVQLIEVPSPTRSAAAVADRLAERLRADGFSVERPSAGWSEAPAVVARFDTERPGRTLQFNGHLDTVHLPFVPPRVENGVLLGSGASDMKGGIAAAVEAMRALRDADLLTGGSLLLTAHDLHESPWGDGSQVDRLIDEGYVGDGVLLPEYLCDRLPVIGRGLAVLKVRIRRSGETIHEVLGGIDQPNVIAAGAEVVRQLIALDHELARRQHPLAGRESLFIGQIGAGEIYNQSPTEFQLAGTRRWLPGTDVEMVRRQYLELVERVGCDFGVQVEGQFHLARDAFELHPGPLVTALQSAHAITTGHELPVGAKPFVDDGNAFMRSGVPAITHGPGGKGAHTVNEAVAITELVRVANVYALTAMEFCPG